MAVAAVEVDDLTVEFARGRRREPFRALDALDLHVPAGRITCLLGPNGSGKTTLLNVLTGLLGATAGRASVLGLDPVGERRALLRRLALVPQETSVYPELTARENLAFHAGYYGVPPRDRARRIDDALELVQLTSRADDRAGTFSGGMQRRLALAKALMMEPELLLLDEPTLGVDVQSREAIWARIEDVADSGRAVLLTTNYMEEAQRLGDRITIIDRGATVVGGTLAELTAQVPEAPQRAEVPRVSLQDVFLHFTGRGLRD
ncbi:ABC transporter ATP-binding protein [Cellulomonas fengjieae]|uniref:ABC transporter ATP-binding protein n=1 Tax=Cellulomonas fengjieae TaxID=2819978 RepID=A0ABS3SKM0_9CELL|nr:ABC transporter ATP-binding protein [Cellulomonas fengjieae]MBO3086283.1 ABC transporter ATP-binding protein [Cellulomonas fengjieae]QVI65676.1 ABC transporter ATP-binding protein [Cellulomonas fengjieae]